MNRRDCNSCQGIQVLTPLATQNRGGLRSLRNRIGDHASFLETMLARISTSSVSLHGSEEDVRPLLERLLSRESDDPAVAMFDAWATIADSLTFYQERLANESYLGTAKQRESVEYLAKLLGYEPRQGLSSSVYLAFEIDSDSGTATIPEGTQAKSTPVPGSNLQPQTFETSEDFVGHQRWNRIRPRRFRFHL